MTEQLIENAVEPDTQAPPEGPIRIAWAPVPKVNLLPLEILEGRRFHRTQLVLGAAVLGALLLGAAGTFGAQQSIGDANDQLTAAQARVAALQTEQARYAAVPKLIAQVSEANQARALAMGSDVLWYRYLNDLDGARPTGVAFTGLSITMTPRTAATAATGNGYADPLTPNGVGVVTVQGTGEQYDQAATWIESVNQIAGLSVAKLTSAAKVKDGGLTFGSSVVVDSDALSHRYDEKKAG